MVRQNLFVTMRTEFTNGNVDTKFSGSRRGQTGNIHVLINTDTDGHGEVFILYNPITKQVEIKFDEWVKKRIKKSEGQTTII